MSKKRRTPQGFKAKPLNPPAAQAGESEAGAEGDSRPGAAQGSSQKAPGQPPQAKMAQEQQAVDDQAPGEQVTDQTADNSQPPAYDIPTWDHSLIDVTPEPVSERDLKNLIRDWRRGRATRSFFQVLGDGYVAVFAAVMVIAMLGGGVWQAQATAAGCNTNSCTVGRTLLPWVVMGAAFALTVTASRMFGPVVASAAEGFWLMDAPIRRGRLLWQRLVGVVIAVGVVAAVLGGLLAALTGYGINDIWRWAAAMAVGAAGLTALAAAEQTWGRTWLITTVQWLLGLAAVGVLFIIVSVAADWFGLQLDRIPGTSSVVWVAIGAGVVLMVAGIVALRRLGMIHRARLVSGGSLIAGMQGAAFAMDFALMRDILVERDSMRRGHVRPKRGHGVKSSALVWREIQRLWRYPKRLLLFVVSIVVPYAVAALGFHTFSPFISSLVLLIAFVPLLGSMRIMTRTKGLARTLPLSNPQIRQAMATVPAILAVIWALATTAAFWGINTDTHFTSLTGAFMRALLTAVAGLLAGVRWISAKSANYSMPMMQTGFGALPPGLMFNLIRGIDIVVLITGPMLLSWSLWIPTILAVIVAIALSGFYSMEEMQAQQEQMKKDREKSQGSGPGAGTTGGLSGLLGGSRPAAQPVTKQKIAPPRGYRTPPVTR
ncbi:MAG: DUF6297 family protein [Propionibacteriaceae bacterium]|nr:DUF6297 family protein [Propionibacteriaceae bacterium]